MSKTNICKAICRGSRLLPMCSNPRQCLHSLLESHQAFLYRQLSLKTLACFKEPFSSLTSPLIKMLCSVFDVEDSRTIKFLQEPVYENKNIHCYKAMLCQNLPYSFSKILLCYKRGFWFFFYSQDVWGILTQTCKKKLIFFKKNLIL